MITMCTDIPYDQTAKAPRWQQFLEEVFIHPDGTADYDLIQYMKKALGYSITGDTRERCLFY
jgi:putative DNA primase/helicase